ncbi:MAG: nuclear transport factor 2 family protein [Candidatus Korobacteraceae bacterium]
MNSPPGNPDFDAGALFDAHMAAEFTAPDLDATMATMTDAPVLTHVPVLTGGYGYDAVRGFYAKYFLKHWPADTQVTRISRTIANDRLIDEIIVSFTHDIEMPAMLPGVKPTGKKVELPHVVVVGIANGKIAYERIYWDQASLLVQIGLLDPAILPVSGVEQARRVLDPTLPSNELIYRAEQRQAIT